VESLFVDPPPQTLDLERVMCASRRYSNGENPAEEKQLLLEALAEAQGNKSKAAERLHWSRMTVYRKIAKYKLDSPPERCQAASAG
jgi:two-component system response regulator HydG